MKLLVTRPLEDATPLAAKLEALGHEATIIPLLQIVPRAGVEVPDISFQALCISSANGLNRNLDLARYKDVPFFAIGPQSANEARRLGFTHVTDKGGNVEGLARTIISHTKPENGPILYLSGAETTGDLEGKLKAQGYTVHRAVIYDALPCDIPGLASHIAEADGVLLYSPRSAKLWAGQIAKASLADSAARLLHFCLSANVASQLPKGWSIRVCETPNENGMLTLLDQAGEAE